LYILCYRCFCGRSELSEDDKETFNAGKKLIEGELRRTSLISAKSTVGDSRFNRSRGSHALSPSDNDDDSDTGSSHNSSIQMVPKPKQSLYENVLSPLRSMSSISSGTIGNAYKNIHTSTPSSKVQPKEVDIDSVLDSDIDFHFDADYLDQEDEVTSEAEVRTVSSSRTTFEKVYNVDIRDGENSGREQYSSGRYSDV